MKRMRLALEVSAWIFAFIASTWIIVGSAHVDAQHVLTQHNDNARTGAYLNETRLNASNVNTSTFGKLFSWQVDGSIYAQPLYLSGVHINGSSRSSNVVYVATMHNSVYAFDADSNETAPKPLWKISLGTSARLPDYNIGPSGYKDVQFEVGIFSTPVLSPSKDALYVVTFNCNSPSSQGTPPVFSCGQYIYNLSKLDPATGKTLAGPVQISGSVAGSGSTSQPGHGGRIGCPNTGGIVTFTPNRQLQRVGLTLAQGNVYVGFSAFGDQKPFRGWVFGYDAATLQKTGTFNTTPDGCAGGVWMSGQGISTDASGLYLTTGNGRFNTSAPPSLRNYGMSLVKLGPDLNVIDYFTPFNWQQLGRADLDFSSAGVLLLPSPSSQNTTRYLVSAGKAGKAYVINRSNLGKFTMGRDNVAQYFCPSSPTGSCSGGADPVRGSPVYWNGSGGPLVYFWPENAGLRSFRQFANGTIQTTPFRSYPYQPQYPGGMLSVSANGNTGGSGIVWATTALLPGSTCNANWYVQPGVLHAFNATSLTSLWNSEMSAADNLGTFAKFSPPTIAGGRVFMATQGLESSPGTNLPPGCPRAASSALEGPALANFKDEALAVAWADSETERLHVRCSADGRNTGEAVSLDETSSHSPALAAGGKRLYLGWTDSEKHLNVSSSTDCKSFGGRVRLDGVSHTAPSLAYGEGRLYLSWIDSNGSIHVASSGDRGQTFDQQTKLAERSIAGPALTFHDGVLSLVWSGIDGRGRINSLRSRDGIEFTDRVSLTITTRSRPAVLDTGTLHIGWTDSDLQLNVLSSDLGTEDAGETVGLGITNNFGPSLAVFRGKVYVGWTGNDQRVLVTTKDPAELNSANLVVYGLKSPFTDAETY